jgi:hypothetical protein
VLAALRAGVAAFDAVEALAVELDRTSIGLLGTATAEAGAAASRSIAVMVGATGLGLVLALLLAWLIGARGGGAPVRAAGARL